MSVILVMMHPKSKLVVLSIAKSHQQQPTTNKSKRDITKQTVHTHDQIFNKMSQSNCGSRIQPILAITILILTVLYSIQFSDLSGAFPTIGYKEEPRPQATRIKNLTADGSPRILIAGPCSGSSATMKFAKVILEAHGYLVFHGSEPLLRPNQKNSFYKEGRANLNNRNITKPTRDEILSESLILYNQKAVRNNKILLIKANHIPMEVMNTLKKMRSKFAITVRSNILDRAVCAVRDCFSKNDPIGHQVFRNGTAAEVCFKRRHTTEKVMADFNDTEKLLSYMHDKEKQNDKRIEMFTKKFAHSKYAAYEDLFMFEYSHTKEIFQISVKAWTDMLQSFGDIEEHIVKAALMPFRDTRQKPSHSSVIYNAEEIKNLLQGTPFQSYYET
jgi:hypothetical protein